MVLTLCSVQANRFGILSLAKTIERFNTCIIQWIKMQTVYSANGFLSTIHFLFILNHRNWIEADEKYEKIIEFENSLNKKIALKQTRNSPPLPSSNSSTYPSFDRGFIAFQATVTELFTVEHSSWIIVGIDGTGNEFKKDSSEQTKKNYILLNRPFHGLWMQTDNEFTF